MARLNEAATGNIDKLYGQISKASSAIQKAQSALMDAADEMDAILVEAMAIGGKVAEIVPSHVKTHIAKLTEIADGQLGPIIEGDSQSALNKLQDLIGSIPYRDIRPQSAEERRGTLSMQPNLAAGPQSAVARESLEDFYRSILQKDTRSYNDNSLSFDKLRESEVYGHQYETDMMDAVNMRMAAPLQTKQIREQARASAEDAMFEDTDLEQLTEGRLDFSSIKAFGGNDGMPIKFDALGSGSHIVGDGVK